VDEDDVELIERVVGNDGAPGLDGVVHPLLQHGQALTVVDRGEEAPLATPQCLRLDLQVLGERQRDGLGVCLG
jgi:hypothetical protein